MTLQRKRKTLSINFLFKVLIFVYKKLSDTIAIHWRQLFFEFFSVQPFVLRFFLRYLSCIISGNIEKYLKKKHIIFESNLLSNKSLYLCSNSTNFISDFFWIFIFVDTTWCISIKLCFYVCSTLFF